MSEPRARIGPRHRDHRAFLGDIVPSGRFVLDTNVIINALAGRGPRVLRDLMAAIEVLYVGGPTCAELAWVRGRLDPNHPETARVLRRYAAVLSRIGPAQVLVPTYMDWLAAGEVAGRAARVGAGGGRKIETAFDRVELISDALTAISARRVDYTIVTEDLDFDILAQLVPGLRVLFYERVTPPSAIA